MTTTIAPTLPYDDGTSSGHAGTDTSHERALRRDANGQTAGVQGVALRMAGQDAAGVTVAELRAHPGVGHHGTASQALSNLAQGGRLVLLAERRGGCHVYVLPSDVGDRERAPERRRRTDLTAEEEWTVAHLDRLITYAAGRDAIGITGDDLRAWRRLIRRLSGR